MTKSLDIVIVNWNAGPQLRSCLDSIAEVDLTGIEVQRVVVVDNASTDGSAAHLGDIPLPLVVLQNEENRGFAAACNQGASGSTANYLLFLNPDTRVFSQSLTQPLSVLESPGAQDIGIIGIQLIDEAGRVARTCARFPTTQRFVARAFGLDRLLPTHFPGHFMAEWDHSYTREVDQVIGAFFLIRRSVFTDLGGFDEQFFVYFEEVDLSLRARRAGWRSVYLADVRAYHKGGGTTDQVKAARLFYSLRSRIRYGFKHFGVASALVLLFTTAMLEPITRLAAVAARGGRSDLKETSQGFVRLWRALPMLCRDVLARSRRL